MTELLNVETGEMVEPLTAMEASALTHAEAAIEQGVEQVGKALAEIRDARLYRATHSTFEAYCESRWGMTPRHANRKIMAAEVIAIVAPDAEQMGPMGPIPNERQARELAPLREHPQVVRDVWKDVQRQTGGKPTATAIRESVKRHLEAVPPAPVQDEAFWNDAAEKLTANGWVAKRDAERPFSLAIVRLNRVSRDITGIDIDPGDLATNIPSDAADCLPQIEAAYQWLHSFVMAQKEF